MKLYILGPDDLGEGLYTLIAETGEGLANHLCSDGGFAKGDLEAHRPERQVEWHKRFGGYQVQFIGEGESRGEMTQARLLELNDEWWAKVEAEKAQQTAMEALQRVSVESKPTEPTPAPQSESTPSGRCADCGERCLVCQMSL